MILAIQQISRFARGACSPTTDLNPGWTMPQARSGAVAEHGYGRGSLLALLPAVLIPKNVYGDARKPLLFSTFLYFITSY